MKNPPAHNRKSMIFSMTSHANDISYGHNRFMSCLRQVMECVVKMYTKWIDLFISSRQNVHKLCYCAGVRALINDNGKQSSDLNQCKIFQPLINRKIQNVDLWSNINNTQKKRHNLFGNPTKIYISIYLNIKFTFVRHIM